MSKIGELTRKETEGGARQTWCCMPIISIFGGGGRRIRNSGIISTVYDKGGKRLKGGLTLRGG